MEPPHPKTRSQTPPRPLREAFRILGLEISKLLLIPFSGGLDRPGIDRMGVAGACHRLGGEQQRTMRT